MSRVAVIGGGVAGLTAAGLLAKRGREVVLFEQATSLGGKAGRLLTDGLAFDTGPTLLALPHFVSSVFAELGAQMPKLHRLKTQCHYVFADGRSFDTFDDLEQTIASAEQLAPGEGPRLRQFYRRAEDIYRHVGAPFLERPLHSVPGFMSAVARKGARALLLGMRMGTLDAMARSLLTSPELVQFVGRFATYVGASPYRASAAYAMIAHVERAYGVHHPEGGMGALVQTLAHASVAAGVDVRLATRASWSHAQGTFWVNGERFDQLIVNSDPTPVASTELSLSGFVLMLRVPRKLNLPHHTILFAPNPRSEFSALFAGELPEQTTIYLCHPAATDPTMAHATDTALYVMVNTPPCGNALAVSALRRRVLAAITPLIGAGATVVAERTPADFAMTGSPNGALYGAVGHGRLGPFQRPRMHGQHRGLFFAGGGTHPGGGVPMVALSGRFAADLAMRDGA